MGLLDAPAYRLPIRTAGYSFGGGGSNGTATTYTDVSMRLPFRLTVPTIQYRIHIRNRDYKNDVAGVGTLTFTGAWVGEHSLSTQTGTPDGFTGAFTTTPTQVASNFTVVDDAEYVSPWVTASASQLAANKQYLLGVGFTAPASTTIYRTYGSMYFVNAAGSAAAAGQTAALGSYFVNPGLLDVWIEYKFAGNNPIGLFIGDSLTEARTGSTVQGINPTGQDSGYPQQHAFRSNSIAVVNAYSGITISAWALTTSAKWNRFAGITPDYVVLWALTNDIGNAVDSIATMETNYLTVVNKIRALYGVDIPIYACTTTPRALTGTPETNRTTLNAWLAARPKNIAGVFDFDRAVRNPATVTSLDSDFDAGDTIHLNTRGYGKLAGTMGGRLVTHLPS